MKNIRGAEIKTTVSGKTQREYEKKRLKRIKDKALKDVSKR